MMAQFFIERLTVSGGGKKSSVNFGTGVNFVVGPSDTGKSSIVQAIDYLFGFRSSKNKPFRFNPDLGYDRFQLFTQTPNGKVVFERRLGENKITLSGTDPNFTYRTYSLGHQAKNNINDVWLQMIGIDEPHKILATRTGKVQQLTWRAMLHMILIKQGDIARTSSVFYNPSVMVNMTETVSKATILFLMTGIDAADHDAAEDQRIQTAKRGAVVEYIRSTIGRLSDYEKQLLKKKTAWNALHALSDYSVDKVKAEIDLVNQEIDELQQMVDRNTRQSRQLMSDIYENNSRLAECDTLVDRFAALRTQYLSDIQRLAFVVDGSVAYADVPKLERCPFCDGEVEASTDIPDRQRALAELQHLRVHLTDLEQTEHDVAMKRKEILLTLEELEQRKQSIDANITHKLKPRLATLKQRLNSYRKIVELTKELQIIQNEQRTFNKELTELELKPKTTDVKYDINQLFDPVRLAEYEERLISILKTCNYDVAASTRFNMNTFDIEIGGQQKALSHGGGYCGFLNTVVALAMVEYLEDSGEYSPGLLVADSPFTQLSEPKSKTKSDTMKVGFLQYLFKNYGSPASTAQIILIDQKEKLPMLDPMIKRAPHINVIEFTGDKNVGRYGFLDGVFHHD